MKRKSPLLCQEASLVRIEILLVVLVVVSSRTIRERKKEESADGKRLERRERRV